MSTHRTNSVPKVRRPDTKKDKLYWTLAKIASIFIFDKATQPANGRKGPKGITVTYFQCPYLNSIVELTEERERHITDRHPDLFPEHRERLADVLVDPEQIRRSTRFASARLFSRWFDNLRGGKHVVVVVVSDATRRSRHWIITAYIARALAGGDIEWQRN